MSWKSDSSNNFKEFSSFIGDYWEIYGGWHELVRSPFFLVAIALLVLTFSTWTDIKWWEDVIGVIPDIVGFTIGGYAIILVFGGEQFRSALSGSSSKEPSPYLQVNVAFVHFISMQVLALLFALVVKSWFADSESLGMLGIIISGFGYGLFLYSLLCAVAAAFALLKVSKWYDVYTKGKLKDDE